MFNNLKDVLNKIYLLAREIRLEEESTYENGVKVESLDILDLKDLEYSGKEKELVELLESLDFESVKIIQTIMYIGRDRYYNESDEYELRYSKYRESLDLNGWNDKDIEIDQIVEKLPLDEYLKDGFEILGIEL